MTSIFVSLPLLNHRDIVRRAVYDIITKVGNYSAADKSIVVCTKAVISIAGLVNWTLVLNSPPEYCSSLLSVSVQSARMQLDVFCGLAVYLIEKTSHGGCAKVLHLVEL